MRARAWIALACPRVDPARAVDVARDIAAGREGIREDTPHKIAQYPAAAPGTRAGIPLAIGADNYLRYSILPSLGWGSTREEWERPGW